MDIMELGAIGELVGAIAVVGSLLYVGLQLRQSNNLARGEAELELSRIYMDYIRQAIDGGFDSIFARGYPDRSLPEPERVRMAWMCGMWQHYMQAMWHQAKRGLLSEEAMRPSIDATLLALRTWPVFARVWDEDAFLIAPEFRRWIEAQRAELTGETPQISLESVLLWDPSAPPPSEPR